MLNRRLKRRIRLRKSKGYRKASFITHLKKCIIYCNYYNIPFLYPNLIDRYKCWARDFNINLDWYLNKIKIK